MNEQVRPTKKQRELLGFIEKFIAEHGYGPSYREIMNGLGYNSVATVALHVNSLIKRGHLRKRGRASRSLEVVDSADQPDRRSADIKPSDEKWLVDMIDLHFSRLEKSKSFNQSELDELYVLVGALKILGFDGAARSFLARLHELKKLS